MSNELVYVRCVFEKRAKHSFYYNGNLIKAGDLYTCNFLCTKVYPPARGITRCGKCKKEFEYEVQEQASIKTRINAKSVN